MQVVHPMLTAFHCVPYLIRFKLMEHGPKHCEESTWVYNLHRKVPALSPPMKFWSKRFGCQANSLPFLLIREKHLCHVSLLVIYNRKWNNQSMLGEDKIKSPCSPPPMTSTFNYILLDKRIGAHLVSKWKQKIHLSICLLDQPWRDHSVPIH